MHELSIMQSTLELVLQHAARNQATKVHRIVLKIGAISGVDPDALRFAHEVVVSGTIAEDSIMEIISVPVRCHCRNCSLDFEAEDGPIALCPRCATPSGDVLQGREMELSQLELS
jgi:hydrogenase nickel incorporation protein HypA/HybF